MSTALKAWRDRRPDKTLPYMVPAKEVDALIEVVDAADDLVTALWDLEWAEDMVIGPKLRAYQEARQVINVRNEETK